MTVRGTFAGRIGLGSMRWELLNDLSSAGSAFVAKRGGRGRRSLVRRLEKRAARGAGAAEAAATPRSR
jgi:hypothetical protein